MPIICLAASMGNTEVLRQLMNDLGYDPYEIDYMGRTSLHYAAMGFIEPRYDVHSKPFNTSLD